MPTSYADVRQTGSGSSKINGIYTSINYAYKPVSKKDSAADMLKAYIDGLKGAGYAVSGTGNSYTINTGATMLATVNLDDDTIRMDIKPGNETLTKIPAAGSVATVVKETPKYRIGDTLKATNVKMTLNKSGVTDKIYSYIGKEPSFYRYYDTQSDKRLFYVQGKFTNSGSRSVDIDYLYMEACFDGKYYYDGFACGLQPNGKDFEDDVASQSTVDYYVFFEVPKTVLNSYKTCTVKIGVEDSFSVKVRKNDRYNFDVCNSVFEIDLSK